MRIVLAYKSHPEGAADPYTSLLPIGLGYLNAILAEAGHDSTLANFSSSSWKCVASYLSEASPDLFGISQFTHNRFESLKLAAAAKAAHPSCFVVLGGPHATYRYRELLEYAEQVDAVVVGEGEETLRELAEKLAAGKRAEISSIPGLAVRRDGKVAFTGRRPPVSPLDALPVPATCLDNSHGIDFRRQLEFITTSRGCPAACRFCSSPGFWQRRVRFRSPRSIADEIRYIRDRFGLIYFSFRDDTFTADRKRVIELCRLLIEEKLYIMWNCQSRVNSIDEEMLSWMKRAGCECIQIGVESGSPRVLKTLDKGIDPRKVEEAARMVRRAGINLSVYLITGVPGEDDADVAATRKLVDAIRPHDGQVSPLAYYPGTALYDEAVASGMAAPDLFEADPHAALLVRPGSFADTATDLLMKALGRSARTNRFTEQDFRRQKTVLGYCHTTNILAGELYEAQGELKKAEKEYREILDREPGNPWGWLALGELMGEAGDYHRALGAFTTLIRLVPRHAPAYTALGELALLAGESSLAIQYYEQALSLDPMDQVAQKGVKAAVRKQKK